MEQFFKRLLKETFHEILWSLCPEILLQLPTLKYNYKFAFLLIQFARTRRDLDEKKKVGSSWILAQIIERLKCPWETVGWVFKIFFIFFWKDKNQAQKLPVSLFSLTKVTILLSYSMFQWNIGSFSHKNWWQSSFEAWNLYLNFHVSQNTRYFFKRFSSRCP